MIALEQSSQITTRTGILTSAGTALSINLNRRYFIIQNLNTSTLFVKFGTSASTTDFDFVLKAGSVSDDGSGGIYTSDSLVYTGLITVAGTTPRFTATEL